MFGFFVVGAVELIIPLAMLFFSLGEVVVSANNLYSILKDDQSKELANLLIKQEVSEQAQHIPSSISQQIFPESIPQEVLASLDSVKVRVEHLNFNYLDHQVIKDLNVEFKSNTSYLISGESGIGKTSFINCITGLETSYSGNIFIDCYDANQQLLASYEARSGIQRQICCHLSQRIHIFTNTVRENLRIANLQASDQQIIQVLNQVGLDYLATDLNEVIGEGNRMLSGGEMRRIGVARLLLSDAKLITLDEPTESIDSYLESQILQQIFSFSKQQKATVIMISHNRNNHSYTDVRLNYRQKQTTEIK